jgi:shikimate kinase
MLMNKKNVYLIGLMGAGKTTVGRLLAKSLSVPFYDSDKAIEDITGVDIATIFEFEGEKGFRIRENKMIKELTELEDKGALCPFFCCIRSLLTHS